MRPRTLTRPAPQRAPVPPGPSLAPAPSASERQEAVDVVRRLRHAQAQVSTMMAQLDQITLLLREAQRARARGGSDRAPLDPATVAHRRARDPRRDRRP